MKIVMVMAFVVIVITGVWLYASKIFSSEQVYEAQCSFRLVDPEESAAAGGDNGTYQELRIVVRNGLTPLLKGGSRAQELLQSYLKLKMARNVSALAVTNAFASADYRLEGEAEKVVRLFVLAETPELALDVNNFILTNYVQSVEAEDRAREEKALAKLRSDIKRKRLANEDVSELLGQLERARKEVEARRRVVSVVEPSYVGS